MSIKTIPLSRLQSNLRATLDECADSGNGIVVEMPDERLILIQPLGDAGDDALTDELLKSNPAFQALVAKSKAGPRTPFTPQR
jgi:hypothetical protein